MKKLNKALSLILVLAMLISMSAFFASAKTMTGIKIVRLPNKLTFYKGTDWNYGFWNPSGEGDEQISWTWKDSTKISFLRNPGSGIYPERGMIDMTGLQVEIFYDDSSSKIYDYTEKTNSAGVVSANILVSPSGEFKVGKNTLVVYLSGYTKIRDSYEIEITEDAEPSAKRLLGDVNNDTKINSSDALLLLMHSVGEKEIPASDLPYADMNGDGKYNSTDALHILNISVGKA